MPVGLQAVTAADASVKADTISATTAPALSDFLDSVPLPLTASLVYFAPYISAVRHVAEVCNWKRSWYESWLAIALLWAGCLLAEFSLRYLLPSLVALSLVWAKRQASRGPSHRTVTEASLQNTISELSLIQELIPSLQSQPFSWSSPPLHVLTRVTASIYIPYLIITYGVPLRILLAISGTFALSWRAPWLVIIRRTLWRSAYVRWSYYSLWARVSGEPMADVRISNQPTLSTPEPVNSLRFLFEIYENQRWWMGLDFTAALLPSERPSWSSKNQQPVSPPNSFNLPEPSIVYLPDSKGGRIKRTATWRWEEPEWTVVIHTKGGVASRVERPLPAIKDDQSMLNKAAAKMRESAGPMSPKITDENKLEDHNSSTQDNGDDSFTDPDGWVFADNSWEHRGARGGMGKYTRYRRWTRIAVASETVEVVDDGDLGLQRGRTSEADKRASGRRSSVASSESEGSPLRQRLRNALARGASVSSTS